MLQDHVNRQIGVIMYTLEQFTGKSLPPKTLCLTYDDGPGETADPGPGPRTLELASYLREQGIGAAFFVVGKHVEQHPSILLKLTNLGHLVGNHTYDHPDLVRYLASGRDPVEQVARAEELIRAQIGTPSRYFRPSYGSWSLEVANALNKNVPIAKEHVGSFSWDISSADYEFWMQGKGPDDCAQAYLAAIERKGNGIVLMHDSTADNDVMKRNNQTCQTTRLLVPLLRERGYKFVRLDQIPEVAAALARISC